MKTFVLLVFICFTLAAADKPIEAVKQVEPNWGDLTSGYLIERAQVEMEILPNGEPMSILSARPALPTPAFVALSEWRFKGGGDGFRRIRLTMPVRLKLTPELERAQIPRWHLPPPVADALKRVTDLDQSKAADSLANLPNAEEPDHLRCTLLVFYTKNGAANPEVARKARRDLLLWLIQTFPQDPILTSSYAIVNASGEPLADPEGNALLKQAWLDAVKQYPDDIAVSLGAVHFLRTTDPKSAVKILSATHDWPERLNWLGNLYAYVAVGVNGVAPESGTPLSAASTKLPDDEFSTAIRQKLLQSTDLHASLSAMATTSNIARFLATRNSLPSGFPEYCEALLKHTRELYPQTSLNCDPKLDPSKPNVGPQRIGGKVMEANVVKKVQPKYPQKAKDHRIQGTVEFTATVGKDGHVQELQCIRGPFLLVPAAREAVMQWEYRPTMLNGNPVDVITNVVVNFMLR